MSINTTKATVAKPILKWAGGKTQMLGELLPRVPKTYGRYIEPFFGGGALFFSLKPENAIIADSNPELINMYLQVANHVDEVIECLRKYKNTSEMFYEIRSLDWRSLPKAEAAARTIYLNKTCFNGLYRVNRSGQFNTPFGKYKNPKICDADALRLASKALQKAEILCGDYILVLEHYAQPGDFVFLDPPYLPISENSDFKRYTKEQFYEDDHIDLAKMIETLHKRGCYIILTNSNHPLVHKLSPSFINELASCDFIKKRQNIIMIGPPGRGKTHLSIALGMKACRAGFKVLLKNAAVLSTQLAEAQDSYKLEKLQKAIARADLLILDELSYISFNRHQSELLFQVISDRSEKKSTIVTTNLPFSKWTDLFENDTMVSALVDRLTFHSHVLDMNGVSYRLEQSTNN